MNDPGIFENSSSKYHAQNALGNAFFDWNVTGGRAPLWTEKAADEKTDGLLARRRHLENVMEFG